MPTNSEIAALALLDEANYRFPSFSASDAITIGLSLRKRFRASSRHIKHDRGLLISIQTIAGHTLFACTVGDIVNDDVGLDKWEVMESMVRVVRSTGHSSFYAEKKAGTEMGLGEGVKGGAYPIWLENATCCPIAVVAVYGGSSYEDHILVEHTIRDYVIQLHEDRDGISVQRSAPFDGQGL